MDTQETHEPRLSPEIEMYEKLYKAMGVKDEEIRWARQHSGGYKTEGTGADVKLCMNILEKFFTAMKTFAARVDRERDDRMEQAVSCTKRLTGYVMGMTLAVVILTVVLVYQGCSS